MSKLLLSAIAAVAIAAPVGAGFAYLATAKDRRVHQAEFVPGSKFVVELPFGKNGATIKIEGTVEKFDPPASFATRFAAAK